MNSNPYTIYKDAPLPQVFTLFRTMGLRHLPVIEESGLVSENKRWKYRNSDLDNL